MRVERYNVAGRLVASTSTSDSGHYWFRFSAPGEYTVKVTVPQGYKAEKPSVTLFLRQFEELRVDFVLTYG